MQAKIWNNAYWIEDTEPKKIKARYEKILVESGFTILNIVEHYFEPHGYTALFLLSESHLAIHTFPEENKTYIEISSCIKKQYEEFIKHEKSKNISKTRII